MSKTLSTQRVRLELDAGSFAAPKDRLTGGTAKIWKGVDTTFDLGVFLGLGNASPTDDARVDLTASAFESITLEVQASKSVTANLIAKTTTDFNDAMTAAQWLDLSAQHARISLTAAETNITAGDLFLVVFALTTGGEKIILGAGAITVVENNAGTAAGDPDVNPGTGLSLITADARYFPQVALTALTGSAPTALDAVVTADKSDLLRWVNDGTEGFGLWHLIPGTTAEDPAAGVVRPDDYAPSTNEQIWIRRL